MNRLCDNLLICILLQPCIRYDLWTLLAVSKEFERAIRKTKEILQEKATGHPAETYDDDGKKGWNKAAETGSLSSIIRLHENRREGCTTFTMNYAAENGHLEVVKWLHANRQEGCTTYAMDYSAKNGHLEVVKWLQVEP